MKPRSATDSTELGPRINADGRGSETIPSLIRVFVATNCALPLDVASDDNQVRGVVLTLDLEGCRASAIESFSISVAD